MQLFKYRPNFENRLRFFCWLIFSLGAIAKLAGQKESKIEKPVFTSISFYYDFPQSMGASAGIDFPIKEKVKYCISGGKLKNIKFRNLLLSADIGFYRYPYNNTGIYFMPAVGMCYYKKNPFYFKWMATMGILRTDYDGIVYSVSANGNVKQIKNFGRYYATTGIATAFGEDFERASRPHPFAIEIKPSLWIQYPYNSFVLPHASIMLGVKYHFRNLNVFIKKKQKTIKKL
jgi:hypothetical protein